ncbi:hypothetical protein [Phenylobacterium sp.]|jgi:uncharacterized protein YecT (DUF1311 family)|uniref:hypothetical protein n=1 Tax=Phenylobacterium sp. TaxID=1871053 RepID=UPI002E376359|nr:hypothetical protein [Phenylobacterium sp.]HEX3363748.1 hypothetical protein [Phenylobacterium sp.]
MPQVNLSALNGQELRQLLDSSRRRGDAALSYQVLQEMAVRRENPAGRRGSTIRGLEEPRQIEVELGEMAEDDDLPPMPNWRPPAREPEDLAPSRAPAKASAPPRGRRKAQPAPAVVPEAAIVAEDAQPAPIERDANRPLSLWHDDPAPPEDEAPSARVEAPRMAPPPVARPPSPHRPGLRLVIGFALGIAVGTALGFWVGDMPRDTPPRPAPAAAPVQTAALAPAPPPVPEPSAPIAAEPAPEASANPAAAQPASPSSAQDVAGDANSRVTEPLPPALATEEAAKSAPIVQPAPERPAATAASGCAREPTPADRVICGDPKLRRLQGDLRQAYAEALAAHEDRTLLRERQLAWRDARNTVSDPTRLAQLYEERIRKLNAATAEALRER